MMFAVKAALVTILDKLFHLHFATVYRLLLDAKIGCKLFALINFVGRENRGDGCQGKDIFCPEGVTGNFQ